MYVRKNVYTPGSPWPDYVLWYARGVQAMQARPIADPTSWRFYGAIHGIDQSLWKQLGYLSPSDPMPSQSLIKLYWNQCQHGSWYFLPWHRGYLLGVEAVLRDAIVKLGGPSDWALPYWNYFNPGQNALPPAFASQDWPDGNGNNPLFIPQRYGPNNDGNVYVPLSQVNMNALKVAQFTGVAFGGDPGFGGVDTGFSHGGRVHGDLETQPHDYVHGLVGGEDPNNPNLPGLMSDPDTAGLDPIFWLHHANIDRLWEVWRLNPPTHVDPTDPKWVKGPGSLGQRKFTVPMPGGVGWDYTPGDVSDLAKLNYQYDDLAPATPVPAPADRLTRLGHPAPTVLAGVSLMPSGENVELIGASSNPIRVVGSETRAAVQLDPPSRSRVTASLLAANVSEPDRVYLNLENVRAQSDATAFQVYVGLAEDDTPAEHPDRLAGSIALFGARKASQPDAEHGGQGLQYVLDITDIVDALHLSGGFDVDQLSVRIVPLRPVPDTAQVSIGRVSIYRQGK